MKRFISRLLIIFFIASCAPAVISLTPIPTATANQIINPSATPTSLLTPTAVQTLSPLKFSITQIRTPRDTDRREVLTAFWSQDGSAIYYALVNGIPASPLWFEISMNTGENFQNSQLSSRPKLTYTPTLPVGGVYLEYQGLISPSGRYHFQIAQANNNYSLSILDDTKHSKVKLLETSDMNFREAYWMSDEKKVVFGIGPEFGTELYLYSIEENKFISSTNLIGYADWGLSEWALSPNGKNIAILNGNQNLKLFSLDGSFSTTIPGFQSNVCWAGNSEKIFYYFGDQIYESTGVGYFDMTTGIATDAIPLSELKKSGVRGFFDVSPNGDKLVFWQAGNIWLLSFD